MTTLHLMVGLPGAGKTTLARQLAAEQRALRLTPDEWMIPLFGAPDVNGRRDVLEGRMLALALEAVRLGIDVVLDFGCWSRDERSAVRSLTEAAGAVFRLVYLPVEPAAQRARIDRRREPALRIGDAELAQARALFEEPDRAETDGRAVDNPPAGSASWEEWAAARWPGLTQN
ncbi:hypothetical protein GCM10010329_44560 [Streptomyces spiroverticillatus]|uniref:AAA family ATPase n=1 Tax=Streptomyces finlayi TaxID=67296 RepID=A0A919CAZ5_9ACTN|nr:ATP-binding protein [Streptomyces finlayi]GHA16702.1 hypothetical protein GCM10010329_44560 [Streptomyces spiroverticillatus]GHC98858.1 hypothetical protein GCM10010334_41740 [Streptomyces finlayi]